MGETIVAKIKVYHFLNSDGGGVLSVTKNLIEFSDTKRFEHHIIYTINKKKNTAFSVPDFANIASVQLYYYSPKWNFYYTCKKLSQLLADDKSVIIANDWLELGMVSHLALQNPVMQILHGDYEYYYDLAEKHKNSIDVYCTVAEVMAQNLARKLSERCADIYYLPFPVPAIERKNFTNTVNSLQIIFVGRLTKDKGYNLLPLIEGELRKKHIVAKWHIVGAATEADKALWQKESEVNFYGQMSNKEVVALMRKADCLVLPSLAEGMPVTIVEAMKAGLTCLVNNLSGGIQELIVNGITGYKIERNTVLLYAEILEQLNSDRTALKRIGENAIAKATSNFDPFINAARYEQQIEKCYRRKRDQKKAYKVYGSRLDKSWIPNFITTIFRTF